MMNISLINARLQLIWQSFRSVPLWVQVWVAGILVPANAASFALLHYWSGQAAAWAAVFVVLTNVPIMYIAGGMSRLMSIPHLIAWFPLQMLLVMRLMGEVGPVSLSQGESIFIIVLLIINGISLVFDTLDSWKWLKGEREIPGRQV